MSHWFRKAPLTWRCILRGCAFEPELPLFKRKPVLVTCRRCGLQVWMQP